MSSRSTFAGWAMAALVLSPFVSSVSAGTLVPASDIGCYTDLGDHVTLGKSVTTGYAGAFDKRTYRSYATFVVPSTSATILSASFQVWVASGDYQSPNYSEKFALYDVKSVSTTVLKWPASGAASIYDDLGTGTVYGSAILTNTGGGVWVNVPLNANGIAFLAASRGTEIAMGGALLAMNSVGGSLNEVVFSSTTAKTNVRLNVNYASPALASVPEPSSMLGASAAIGLTCVVARLRRGRRRAV